MYNKLMLKNGETLSETHLNHIENGVLEVEKSAAKFRKTIANILTAKGVPAYETDSFDTLSNKINLLGGGKLPPNEGDGESNGLIDIRQTVKSGQIQLVCTDSIHGNVRFRVYTTDGSMVSVDWGDGTSDVYSSGEDARHAYQSGTGQPYLENNNQWVATISAGGGNVIYRFINYDNSDYKWFASRDIYFRNVAWMFAGADTTVHAPSGLLYVDIIGGALVPDGSVSGGDYSANGIFRSCVSLERITGVINTSRATSAYSMFQDCYNLVEMPDMINISSATHAGNMFQNCRSLPRIPDLVSTRNLNTAYNMFHNCQQITEIPDLYFDSVTDNISSIFYGCEKLENAENIYNTGKATNANNIFYRCSNLKRVPSVLDLGKATETQNLFYECMSLEDAPSVLHLDSTRHIGYMFYNCKALKNAPTTISAPNAQIAWQLFYNCSALRKAPTNILLPKATVIYGMFQNCRSLVEAPVEMDFPEVIEAQDLFNTCEMLQVPPERLNLPKALQTWNMFNACISLKETPREMNLQSTQRTHYLFNGCNSLETLHFDELVLDNALEIYSLFNGCRVLKNSPKIIAPKAQVAYQVFSGCSKLQTTQEIELPEAIQVHEFYKDCRELTEIKPLITPKAQNWNGVYRGCKMLQRVATIGGPEVQQIQYLFHNDSPIIAEIPNYIDFTSVTQSEYCFPTNDPVRIRGKVTIKGLRTNLNLYNCRQLTSIRFDQMDPLCGNLDFRNCAMEAEALNLLFGDLVETVYPMTINVSGNPGAQECDPSIAEAKGWKVNR